MYCVIKKSLGHDDVKCPYQKEKSGFCLYLSHFVFQYNVCCYLIKEKEEKDALSEGP